MAYPAAPDLKAQLEIIGAEKLVRDRQSVTPDGRPLFQPIDGVRERRASTHTDERGSICEMFSSAWRLDEEPVTYVYQASLLPSYVKGWVLHYEQDDRLFFSIGRMRLVLFDGRACSPTFQCLNRFEAGEINRCLIRVPAGVYHAVQNIGEQEAFFFNMPTKPYRHEAPDKYRLPLNNDVIPYRFGNVQGW